MSVVLRSLGMSLRNQRQVGRVLTTTLGGYNGSRSPVTPAEKPSLKVVEAVKLPDGYTAHAQVGGLHGVVSVDPSLIRKREAFGSLLNGDAVIGAKDSITFMDGMGGAGPPGSDVQAASILSDALLLHGNNLSEKCISDASLMMKRAGLDSGGVCVSNIHVSADQLTVRYLGDCKVMVIDFCENKGLIKVQETVDAMSIFWQHLNAQQDGSFEFDVICDNYYKSRHIVEAAVTGVDPEILPYECVMPLSKNSVVIAGTDGLWDNFTQWEIVELVSRNSSMSISELFGLLKDGVSSRMDAYVSRDSRGNCLAVNQENEFTTKVGMKNFFGRPKIDDMGFGVFIKPS